MTEGKLVGVTVTAVTTAAAVAVRQLIESEKRTKRSKWMTFKF